MKNEDEKIEMEDEYRPLKVTPAMAQYLRDIAEGREELIGPYKDGEDMVRQILGDDWREKYHQC